MLIGSSIVISIVCTLDERFPTPLYLGNCFCGAYFAFVRSAAHDVPDCIVRECHAVDRPALVVNERVARDEVLVDTFTAELVLLVPFYLGGVEVQVSFVTHTELIGSSLRGVAGIRFPF